MKDLWLIFWNFTKCFRRSSIRQVRHCCSPSLTYNQWNLWAKTFSVLDVTDWWCTMFSQCRCIKGRLSIMILLSFQVLYEPYFKICMEVKGSLVFYFRYIFLIPQSRNQINIVTHLSYNAELRWLMIPKRI